MNNRVGWHGQDCRIALLHGPLCPFKCHVFLPEGYVDARYPTGRQANGEIG